MFQNPFLRILTGITLGALIALAIFPQTRWVLFYPISPFIALAHRDLLPSQKQPGSMGLAAQHPTDFSVQYATALRHSNAGQAAALEALVPQFPDNIALRANILRYASLQIYLKPVELTARRPTVSVTNGRLERPVSAQGLALFVSNAKAGERLDPQNAYFPFMMAVGLYAQHNDAAAQTAILKAGQCTKWNEYIANDIKAQWKLDNLFGVPQEAIAKSAIAAAELLPQYGDLRAATGIATSEAIHDEVHGRIQHGIALRQALIHTGGLMRGDSTTAIGSLVGIAVEGISMARPDGQPMPNPKGFGRKSPEQQIAYASTPYLQFLSSHGFSSLVPGVQKQATACAQTKSLMNKIFSFNQPPEIIEYRKVMTSQIAYAMILANILFLIALGLIVWVKQKIKGRKASGLSAAKPAYIGASVLIVFVLIGAVVAVSWVVSLIQGLHMLSPYNNMAFDELPQNPSSGTIALVILSGAAIPIMVLVISLLLSRRIPWSQGVTHLVPYALSLTLLIFCGAVIGLSHQEQMANNMLNHIVNGEGQYLAQVTGQKWPGVVEQIPAYIQSGAMASMGG